MSTNRSRGFTTHVSIPEMELVASQLEYLKRLNVTIQNEEGRVREAREAIPKLQILLAQRREETKSFSGILSDLMRLQTQPRASIEDSLENPFIIPALQARVEYGRLTRLAAEAKEYRRSLSDSLDIIEKQIDTAHSVISASGGVLARMQSARSSMLESIRHQYELIHPIHRLPDSLLAYIFSLIVSEKFENIRRFRGDPEDCPKLDAPVMLASVCSTWKDIAYNNPSLWNRVVVTDVSTPSPYWRNRAAPPIAVVAVGGALVGNDHAPLPSLASRTLIDDLTITSTRLSVIQFDLSRINSIRRLTVAYPEFHDEPVTFSIPAVLTNLSSLTCIHSYPSLRSPMPLIKDLSVHAGVHYPQSTFERVFRYTPNLETLSHYGSPAISISRKTTHQSLSTIKAHFSAIRSLASALSHGDLVLPKLTRLEISDLGHENLLENWSEVFPFDSWPSQVTYLHIELRTKFPRVTIAEPDQLYRLLIPFEAVTTLSLANEPLLAAILPAGVVPVARRLVRLRVEGCAFDGRALLDVVRRRNGSEWVARGEIMRLAVQLWDCPNVPPKTMRELRRLQDD
jgi:hypothetical protein